MARKTQLDRVVEALMTNRGDIVARSEAECAAIDAALRVIAEQTRGAKVRKAKPPKAVTPQTAA